MSKELFIKVGLKLPEDSEEEFTQEEIDQMTLDYVKEFNRCPEIEYDINISFEDIEKKQLTELKAELAEWKMDGNMAILELQQQLKEKDEAIKHLKATDTTIVRLPVKELSEMQSVREERIKKEITHQVCEKIREKTQGLWYFVLEEQKEHFEGNRYVLSQKDFNDILDQIEKGENNDRP